MIIYNGKNSETDFDLYVSSAELPPAERKVIEETVPYMSGIWDFSYHDEDIDEYEPVTIKYSFDVFANTKQELRKLRDTLVAWVHSKGDGRLYDSDISLREYYEVYRAQAGWTENGLQGLLTVEFLCYPFRKTENKRVTVSLGGTNGNTVSIEITGFRKIKPIIIVPENCSCILEYKNSTYALSSGTYNNVITLDKGENTLKVSGNGLIFIEYWSEVL